MCKSDQYGSITFLTDGPLKHFLPVNASQFVAGFQWLFGPSWTNNQTAKRRA